MAPHSHPSTTFDADTKYRLFLRVHSARDLQHKSAQGAYCKLYVGDSAMLDGSQKKLLKKASSESNNNDDAHGHDDAVESVRVFRTHTKVADAGHETHWDETFEVSILDPTTEIMSVRIKSQHRFYCPVIGTFAVYLRHLRVGEQADQWFPLHRGKKEAGKIRLHLLLTPEAAGGRAKKKRNSSDLSADIKVALAANHEADKAIERLVQKQLKDEEERRLRKQRGEDVNVNQQNAAGALGKQLDVVSITKVKEPSAPGTGQEARFFGASESPNNQTSSDQYARLKQVDAIAPVPKEGRRNGDALGLGREGSRFAQPTSPSHGPSPTAFNARSTVPAEAERDSKRNENFARLKELDTTPVASEQQTSAYAKVLLGSGRGSSRNSLPSTPSSAARPTALYSIPSFGIDDLHRSKRHSSSSTDSDSLAEYERRIDRKLRKVRKETEKLRKIRKQLKKYIPDLASSDSESESSTSSSGDEKRRSSASRHAMKDKQTRYSSDKSDVHAAVPVTKAVKPQQSKRSDERFYV
uniref:C2 domain-containing protein n=1 Tax=Globisporangium ultimum (strain ATCC 200006 / CBS 805.95 / DAOM BR144) TaxID=431595 RepID=K3WVD1_GLOUD